MDDSIRVSRIVSGRGDVGNMEGDVDLVSIVFSFCVPALVALSAGLCAVVELGLVSTAVTTGAGTFSSIQMVHVSLKTKGNYNRILRNLVYHMHPVLKRLIQWRLSSRPCKFQLAFL